MEKLPARNNAQLPGVWREIPSLRGCFFLIFRKLVKDKNAKITRDIQINGRIDSVMFSKLKPNALGTILRV